MMTSTSTNDSHYFSELEKFRAQNNVHEFYNKIASQYESILDSTHFHCIQDYAANLLKDHLCGNNIVDDNIPVKEAASDHLPDDSNYFILDVGCGPGKTGVALNKAGFNKLDGVDPSSNMIKIAELKNIYSNLINEIITEENSLSCKDDTYDGVFCTHTISKGHLHIQPAVKEFCRVIKAGGYAVFTISPTIEAKEFMGVLADFMCRKIIEITSLEKKDYRTSDNVSYSCYICLMRVLK